MDKARENEVSTSTHEINNKLTAIIGVSELLLEHWGEWDDKKKKEIVEMVVKASYKISDEVIAIRKAVFGSVWK